MKLQLSEEGQKRLRKDLIKLISNYLDDEDKSLMTTTTNMEEEINKNINLIIKKIA